MTNPRLSDQVKEVFDRVLGQKVGLETEFREHPDFDSLVFMRLVVELEGAFKVRFRSTEILAWNQPSDVVRSLSELKK